jgi:membrane fusion protein, multidrug efflux system
MSEIDLRSDPGARRVIGRMLGIAIIAAAAIAVVVALLQWEIRPQTDDASIRANFVGIAPEVNGQINEILVHDNQRVEAGDLLFVIDPRPYEIALDRARANLALTRKEVNGLKDSALSAGAAVSKAEADLNASAANVTSRETDPVVADAEIKRLEAQYLQADNHLKRVEPMASGQFVTADSVDQARTQRDIAAVALEEARAKKSAATAGLAATRAQHVSIEAALQKARSDRSSAEDAIGETDGVNARVVAAEAAVHSAELDLSHCRVRAPFPGLVVNMNISNGAFAHAGTQVFTLVDTRTWYVVANFRETQLGRITSGAPTDLYLLSQPGKHYRGTVVGLGWAVAPENAGTANGLPSVDRSLDWIQLAARFPVRIKVENPDDSFRIGASAVATVHGTWRSVGP